MTAMEATCSGKARGTGVRYRHDGNLEDLEGEAREVHKRISHTLPTLDTHSGKLTRKDQTLFCL